MELQRVVLRAQTRNHLFYINSYIHSISVNIIVLYCYGSVTLAKTRNTTDTVGKAQRSLFVDSQKATVKQVFTNKLTFKRFQYSTQKSKIDSV